MPGGPLLVGAAVLLASYAAIERLFGHLLLARIAHILDRRAHAVLTTLLVLAFVGLSLAAPWSLLQTARPLVWLITAIGLLLSWNAATRDQDPVSPGPSGAVRLVLVAFALLALHSPLAVVLTALLLSARFGFWQHHAAFPMRVHLLLVAYVACVAVGQVSEELVLPQELTPALDEALVVLLSTMLVSHYLITALAKIWLGPKPWSWMLHNRLHYLGATAYSWGWARFVPWSRFRRGLGFVRRVEVPLQAFVFLLELTSPLALLGHGIGAAFAFAFAGFHVGVWLLSGLCFWDWFLTDIVLGLYLLSAPSGLGQPAFALGLAVLVLFPLRHKLWKPMPLAWYDSPLTQRVHWFVRGVSGQEYRLDNGFMCPHERLYGKVHGCFAVDAEVLTYHLGECFRAEVRDAIVAAGPNPTALAAVRRHYGVRTYDAGLAQEHVRYLQAFFALLNAGATKALLPRLVRFLKAPGDQMFYWGEGEAYARQEPISHVRLVFREEYFDGRALVRLCDEEVLGFDVPDKAALPLVLPRERTPRELDDFLLGRAAGRLIRISGVRGRYLAAEDAVRSL